MFRSLAVGCVALSITACRGPGWESELEANPYQVAVALHDPVEMPGRKPFDKASIPLFEGPTHVRPCCAFGMDLRAEVAKLPVPGYENSNILGPDDLGHHGYGDSLGSEKNGLVYTCRGGFIDIAHVRDNADRVVYMATRIARALPDGVTVELPDEGAKRRVIVKPLPEGMLDAQGRWSIAAAIAEWANFQFSVWHEIITWYGWESTPGFSEKISAFTPEDLYSNVLGQRIAGGIIANRELRSREQYGAAMDSWIPEALHRLGAVTLEESRHAMKAVDGLWWDSKKRLPDWKLVLRRYLDIGSTLKPWIVADSLPPDRRDPELVRMCTPPKPILALTTPTHVGDAKVEDLARLELELGADWKPPQEFVAVSKGQKVVTPADFPAFVADIRRAAAKDLGPDFDRPKVGTPEKQQAQAAASAQKP